MVGLLPITGIPLPLVSFGGSALVPTMLTVGMLLSFARHEPAATAMLSARAAARREAREAGEPAASGGRRFRARARVARGSRGDSGDDDDVAERISAAAHR